MADQELASELEARLAKQPLLGGASAKIGPQPEPSTSRWLLEMLTGYPADPTREMDPLDALGMMGTVIPGGGVAKTGIKGLYSRLTRAAEGLPKVMKGPSALNTIKKFAHPEEIQWRGVEDFLKAKGNNPVQRDELLEHLAANPLQVDVKTIGLPGDTYQTQWSGYQMPYAIPGSYREDLLKLPITEAQADLLLDNAGGLVQPTKGFNHISTEFPSDPNILAWVRHNQRQLPSNRQWTTDDLNL